MGASQSSKKYIVPPQSSDDSADLSNESATAESAQRAASLPASREPTESPPPASSGGLVSWITSTVNSAANAVSGVGTMVTNAVTGAGAMVVTLAKKAVLVVADTSVGRAVVNKLPLFTQEIQRADEVVDDLLEYLSPCLELDMRLNDRQLTTLDDVFLPLKQRYELQQYGYSPTCSVHE